MDDSSFWLLFSYSTLFHNSKRKQQKLLNKLLMTVPHVFALALLLNEICFSCASNNTQPQESKLPEEGVSLGGIKGGRRSRDPDPGPTLSGDNTFDKALYLCDSCNAHFSTHGLFAINSYNLRKYSYFGTG